MADKTGIQWTDATWNPTTGCDRVSPGCANCYAATLAPRLQAMAIAVGKHVEPTDPYMRDGDPKTSGPGFGFQMHESRLDQPLRWKRPRRIFVNSMSDLFHPEMNVRFLAEVFAVMVIAKQHTFQVLTKRPDVMRAWLNSGEAWLEVNAALWRRMHPVRPGGNFWDHPIPNVWLGTSVENARWRTRIDELRRTPAAVRFLSCEPLLGPLTLPNDRPAKPVDVLDAMVLSIDAGDEGARLGARLDLTGIHWVIVGGESGPGARPMPADWVREIVAECRKQGAAPYVKQMGEVWSHEALGHPGHGGDIETFPADLRVREWPVVS